MQRLTRRHPVVPPFWADFYQQTHIPAAVLYRDELHVTGHTGTLEDGSFPEGVEAQIRQTFRNIEATLKEARASWDDVVEITSYHLAVAEHGEALLRIAAEFLSDPYPAWTAVGVTGLFEPEAVIEIGCLAYVGPR